MVTSDIAVNNKVYLQLADEKPLGRYLCTKGDQTIFMVRMYGPPGMPTKPFPGLPSTWTMYLHAVFRDVFQALEARQAEAKAEAERTRQALEPAGIVAIAARDLPDAVRPAAAKRYEGDILRHKDYRICATVVQVQGPLVQVQIGVQSLFVKREAIWPFRKAVPLAGGPIKSDWENWCVES